MVACSRVKQRLVEPQQGVLEFSRSKWSHGRVQQISPSYPKPTHASHHSTDSGGRLRLPGAGRVCCKLQDEEDQIGLHADKHQTGISGSSQSKDFKHCKWSKQWYHRHCAKISSLVFSDSSTKWFCETCYDRQYLRHFHTLYHSQRELTNTILHLVNEATVFAVPSISWGNGVSPPNSSAFATIRTYMY